MSILDKNIQNLVRKKLKLEAKPRKKITKKSKQKPKPLTLEQIGEKDCNLICSLWNSNQSI